MKTKDTFVNLLQRLRNREDAAVEELVSAYETEIRLSVRGLLNESHLRRRFDSLDIVQSVMLRFCLSLAAGEFQIETPAQLVGLLNKMAFNRFLDQVKHETAQERDCRRASSDVGLLEAVACDQPGPSTVVGWRDEFAEIHRRLTDAERDLARRWAHGETWAEIAGPDRAEQDRLRHKLDTAFIRVARQLAAVRQGEVTAQYLEAVYRWVLEQGHDRTVDRR